MSFVRQKWLLLFALVWNCGNTDASAQAKEELPPVLHVIVEFIEVEHIDYSDWLLENRLDSNADELRASVQKWIGKGRGKIVDSVVCVAKSGLRGKIRSGEEYVFPSEFDPPEVPNKVNLSGKATAPVIPVGVTAYKTENLGTTLEVDPILGRDRITVDLNLAPEIVKLKHRIQWPSAKEHSVSSVEMPIFHHMRITTQITTFDGQYVLLGTTRPMEASDPKRKSPLVLQFVRVDVGRGKSEAEIKK